MSSRITTGRRKGKSVRFLTETAVVAALYVSLTYLSFVLGLSSGVVQFRLSEMLCGLIAFSGSAVPGLTIGCFLANLLTGCALPDILIGTIATFLGAVFGYLLGGKRSKVSFLATLPTVVFNTLAIPPVLLFVYHTESAAPIVFASVFVGEAVCAGIGGTVLAVLLRKNHFLQGERNMSECGHFIVVEGIDGAGKTTQIGLLTDYLRERGLSVVTTREPTDLPTGKKLRRALSGELSCTEEQMCDLFVEDRIAHNLDADNGIRTLLRHGKTVICDRYYYSTLAYQGSVLDYETVKKKNVGVDGILRPDLCLFLDLTPEESLKRISKGRSHTEIYENAETLTRVRKSFYRVIEDLSSEEKITVIDASRSVDEVAEEIRNAVSVIL